MWVMYYIVFGMDVRCVLIVSLCVVSNVLHCLHIMSVNICVWCHFMYVLLSVWYCEQCEVMMSLCCV